MIAGPETSPTHAGAADEGELVGGNVADIGRHSAAMNGDPPEELHHGRA
jgi:hypothetical protein